MKKIYMSAMFASLGAIAFGQDFVQTTYRGAFEPAPTAMWTDGWSNWDPQNTVYGTSNVTITTDVTTNTTWTANNIYLLQGQIFVKNGATLTIEPGTIILGDKASTGAGLFVTKGSKLIANGTSTQPIVFTSNQDPGSRALGDWGGVILLGKASNNNAGGLGYVEGLAQSSDTEYGGGTTPDDADNSGSLQYVRIEFGGYVYQPNKEINGLTLGAVGSGTTLSHIQVSFANDDGFEWFGGAVNADHLVSYRNLDDDFDTDNGFHGHVQFGLIVRDPQIADNPSVSTSEGFESDNDPTGDNATPQTSAIFSNVTAIGPLRGDVNATVADGFRRGARIRRNSDEKIYNSIFMDFLHGVHIDGTACESNATTGGLKYMHNIVAGNLPGDVTEVNSGSSFAAPAWFAASMNDSITATTGILVNPYNFTSPDYRPAASSPALTNADFTDPSIAPFTGFLGLDEVSSVNGAMVYPNPATNNATLAVSMNNASDVEISLMNTNGVVVNTIMNGELTAGQHSFAIETSTLAAGVYFAVVRSNNSANTIRFVVVK